VRGEMMLPSTSARSPLFALALTASAALIFIFGLVAWQRPPPVSFAAPVHEGQYVCTLGLSVVACRR